MTGRRIASIAILGVAAAFTVAACTGTTVHVNPAPAATTAPAIHNPVDILRKATGCVIPADEKIGQPTYANDGGLGYYATCTYGADSATQTNEQLEVWRYPDHKTMLTANGAGPTRRDGMTFILGDDWFAEVTAGDAGLASGPPPALIAGQLGGKIS